MTNENSGLNAAAGELHIEEPVRVAVLVPIEPTDAMWSGIAHEIMKGRDLQCNRTNEMRKHLQRSGYNIPAWLDEELNGARHISKGDMCVMIYKAMVHDFIEAGEQNV